jgi:hypothetical protein
MDQSVGMKFCSSCPLKHMQCHYGSMCLNEVQFSSNGAIEKHIQNVYHPIMGQMCLDETQFTPGHPIMDESFWMKLSSHWAMSSCVEMFG